MGEELITLSDHSIRYLDDAIVDLVDAYPQVAAYRAGALRQVPHPVAARLIEAEASIEEVAATIGRTELYKKGKEPRGPAHAVSAALTTDDLGDVLAETMRLVISHAYDAQDDHRAFLAPVEARDYHPQQFPEIDISDSLDRVFEGEEAEKTGIVTTTGESATLKTWGRVAAVTRKALLSDTGNAFTLLGRRLGDAASRNEANEAYTTIEDNPTLADGAALWSGESLVTTTSLDAAGLAAGMAALRDQKTVGGRNGNWTARFLLVPSADEGTALELVRNITIGNTPRIRVIASPWLAAGAFYLLADPMIAPVIGLLHLRGAQRTIGVSRGFDRKNRRQMISIFQDMAIVPLSRRGGVKVTS